MMQPGERVPGLLMIAFLATIAAGGCGSKNRTQTEGTDAAQVAAGGVVPVEIAVAERQALAVTKTYTGSLEGEEQANIIPKLSERITAIRVRVGDAVRAGQTIVELDKGGVTSQYFQADAGFRNAEKTLQRMKSLYDEGAVSLQVLDGAQTAYDVSRANFEAARGAVELATPIAGVVTAINASVGDLANPAVILATVARINRMKVIFSCNESDVPHLSLGQRVRVSSESRQGTEAIGRIVQLSKSADIRSRSFEIRALFENTAERWFKPGMYCTVEVQLTPAARTLVVPNGAIQSDGVTNRVFVVRNGKAYLRPVQIGVSDGTASEILGGLNEQDTVVTTGATSVRDSGSVTIAARPAQ